jgi:hypothetical protein
MDELTEDLRDAVQEVLKVTRWVRASLRRTVTNPVERRRLYLEWCVRAKIAPSPFDLDMLQQRSELDDAPALQPRGPAGA